MIAGMFSLKVSYFHIVEPAVQGVFLQLPLGWGHKSVYVSHAVLRLFFSLTRMR